MSEIYKYSVITQSGEEKSIGDYEGKCMLIVNTATGCGFTPQYEAIEALYEKYHDKGLEVIDIPCNQFMEQAPGTDEEITQFCQLHYNTQFPQMKKSDVNGENALPLYGYLKKMQGFKGFGDSEAGKEMDEWLRSLDPDYDKNDDIKWNFTKFVVCPWGNVIGRFEPTEGLEEAEEAIKYALDLGTDWRPVMACSTDGESCSTDGEACEK